MKNYCKIADSPAKMGYGKSPAKMKGSFMSKHCASPLKKKSCKKY